MDGIRVLGVLPVGSPGGPELTIDGRPLGEALARYGVVGYDEGAVPPPESRPAFLRSLVGEGPSAEENMRAGRIALLVCSICGDGSCGVLVGAAIDIVETTVVWRDVRWEREWWHPPAHPATETGTRRFRRRPAPQEFGGWEPDPDAPSVTLVFDRRAYEATVRTALIELYSPPAD